MATEGENVTASSSNFDEEIKKLLGKGKVHMVCSEFLEAVKCFEEATKKLDAKFGEAADQCGEAYFFYGKSLLEVARMEGGVLGNALQGAIELNEQEDGTKEGKCEEANKESSAAEITKENKADDDIAKETDMFDEKKKDEKETEDEKGDTNKDESKDEEKVAEAAKDEEKNHETTAESKEESEQEGEENDENNEEDEENMETEGDENPEEVEDEPTYMELAWQMLEMARIIFSKRDAKEGKLMLGQCHLKLGEIQMEQEQFLSAVEDFLKCLDIQKELLSPDDRLLAETAYNIGLAFSFQSMYDKSKDYFSQALETIGLRIKSLEESIKEAESKSKGKEKATPDNPLVANIKELKELQELYPEVKLKVDDAEEMMKQAKDKPSITSVMGKDSTTTIGFGDSGSSCKEQHTNVITTKKKPVAATDISHLVHRNKRKPEEANDDSSAKKPRQDTDDTELKEKPIQATNNNGQPAAMET